MTYIIQKQFIFKEKVFYKDKTLTSADLSASDIERLVFRGFIKSTDESSAFSHDVVSGLENKEAYLLPGKVNKLNKDDLVEYATRIGVGEFDPTMPKGELQELVNSFIASASKTIDDEDDDEDDDEGDA